MNYVDGFVAAVPTEKKEEYRAHVEAVSVVFREFGALAVIECWGDDVPEGKVTDFRRAVQLQPNETVVFSWVAWPDRATRNAGMKRVMADPRLHPDVNPMPFDGRRMIFGGFEVLVEG